MKSQRLTFYLMREEVSDFAAALDASKEYRTVSLAEDSGLDGEFHYLPSRPSMPAWASFVEPVLQDKLDGVLTSSAAAVLLLRIRGRIFALTFSFGRSLLDLAKIENQFGLRVALNRIDARQIRSLDTKTYEDMVVSTNTQASKSAELPTFGVDVSTDILRAVTGEPRDPTFATRISGADSLIMGVKTHAPDLPSICSDLLDAYRETTYKRDFEWIDQLTTVKDSTQIDNLNTQLVAQLQAGDTGATHLAMPDPLIWNEIDGFKITGTGDHEYTDLDLSDYLEQLGTNRNKLSLAALKNRHVQVRFNRSGNFDKQWTLYRCIVTEQRLDGNLHVLIEGRWFAVSETLVEKVDHFTEGLHDARLPLPPAQPGEVEPDYNTRLADQSPNRLLKLDARIHRPGGASSGIEFCDVFSDEGELIHVKRESRSATLSHLFAQGTVSALTFINDDEYRTELRGLINQTVPQDSSDKWLNLIPPAGNTVERSKYRVTYAVITDSKREGRNWLPFFSKLNLMQHAKQLVSSGFEVAVARVPIADR